MTRAGVVEANAWISGDVRTSHDAPTSAQIPAAAAMRTITALNLPQIR